MKNSSIILGIDPGTCITGYGIVRSEGPRVIPIDFGCIRPPRHLSCYARYLVIFEALETLLAKHHPEALAIESQFVSRNPQSALKLGIAKGMAILAALKKNIPIFEYAPKKAKLAVTGNANASKQQVQKMIQLLFCLETPPQPEDAADALALAICHCHASRGIDV